MKKIFLTVLTILATVLTYAQRNALDQSFGDHGFAITDFEIGNFSPEYPPGLIVQQDGKYLVSINSYKSGSILARYNSNGSIDSGFGRDGFVVDGGGRPLPNGKMVSVRVEGSSYLLLQYNNDGRPDRSFGHEGIVTTIGEYSQIQPDGKILVAGEVETNFGVVRYNTDGSLDRNFGIDGLQTTDFGGFEKPTAFLLLNDGKILTVGSTITGSHQKLAVVEYTNNGSLETSFGINGKQVYDFGDSNFEINRIVAEADGKILGGGFAEVMTNAGTARNLVLGRINSDGSLDSSFGNNGIQTSNLLQNASSFEFAPGGKFYAIGFNITGTGKKAIRFNYNGYLDQTFGLNGEGISGHDVAVQPDGKVVICYTFGDAIGVSRYNTDGTPDVNFGDSNRWWPGSIILQTGIFSTAGVVTLLPNGQVMVTAHSNIQGRVFPLYNHTLIRLNNNGLPDQTFARNGVMTNHYPYAESWFNAVAVQKDGKIIAAGNAAFGLEVYPSSYAGPAFARYNVDGTLDESFGNKGKLILSKYLGFATSVAIQADGKILIKGVITEGFNRNNLFRYNSDGTPDMSFSEDGETETIKGGIVLPQIDGKIIVAGERSVVRFNVNGTPDNSFDNDGIASLSFDIYTATLQEDGKILVAGGNAVDNNVLVTRLNSNGTFDNSFDHDGNLSLSLAGLHGKVTNLVVQKDGKIVVAGYGKTSDDDNFVVGRLNPDGSVDEKFGYEGLIITDLGFDEQLTGLLLQQNGKIVVVGSTGFLGFRDIAIVRYNDNGKLDKSFGNNGSQLIDCWFSNDVANAAAINKNQLYVVGYTFGEIGSAFSATKAFVSSFKLNGSADNLRNNVVYTDTPKDAKATGLQVQVLPNPSNYFFDLHINGNGTETIIRITDALGKLIDVKRISAGTNHISVGNSYEPGIYYLEVIQGKEKRVLKLIKNQ